MNDNDPWILKYAPKTVDDMVLSPELKTIFSNMISSGTLNNISLFGGPGIGKTTLSKILVENLNCEYLLQPCSVDGSIDMIKSSIKNFCDIIPKGKYKVVILDEADQLSQQAQAALRNMIVDSMKNCRFILTANYQDKIIEPIKSRCTPVKLNFSMKDLFKFCLNILKKEEIKYSREDLSYFYENIIKKKFPDVRSIIETLNIMSNSGKLSISNSANVDIKDDIVEYIHAHMKDDIKSIRQYLIENEDRFSADYIKLAESLFDVYDSNAQIMSIIADSLWRMSFQLDKEIQFIGMLINIKEILK